MKNVISLLLIVCLSASAYSQTVGLPPAGTQDKVFNHLDTYIEAMRVHRQQNITESKLSEFAFNRLMVSLRLAKAQSNKNHQRVLLAKVISLGPNPITKACAFIQPVEIDADQLEQLSILTYYEQGLIDNYKGEVPPAGDWSILHAADKQYEEGKK